MIKNLCILGGGTSGMICALIHRASYPLLDIRVAESKNIGIVGVGEGSTEHWRRFMDFCAISLQELIAETDATLKTGIMFNDWNRPGHKYMHSINGGFQRRSPSGISSIFLKIIADGGGPKDIVPYTHFDSVHFEPLETVVNQFHFDTNKLNAYLHKKCRERNIEIVEADVVDIEQDENGYVKSLITDDNQNISADFFVDCSGFKRVIISKLGAKWIGCSNNLPMNSAIAFPTEYQEDIPSYTASNAVSAGWMWRIPTQERFGNGYVFCDEFITEDQAVAEAQSYFEKPISVGKRFKFEAGYVDKFWIKNCVALGLAGSFVEPLEASSIGTSIQQSFGLAPLLQSWEKGMTLNETTYNKQFEDILKNIIDFIQLHYITKREDTEFWKWLKNNIELTDFNKSTLEEFKRVFPMEQHFSIRSWFFHAENWINVMHGLEMFDIESIKKIADAQDPVILQLSGEAVQGFKDFVLTNPSFTHRQVLKELSERSGAKVVSFQ